MKGTRREVREEWRRRFILGIQFIHSIQSLIISLGSFSIYSYQLLMTRDCSPLHSVKDQNRSNLLSFLKKSWSGGRKEWSKACISCSFFVIELRAFEFEWRRRTKSEIWNKMEYEESVSNEVNEDCWIKRWEEVRNDKEWNDDRRMEEGGRMGEKGRKDYW